MDFAEFLVDTSLPCLTAIYRDFDYDPRFPAELQKLKVLPARAAITTGLLAGLVEEPESFEDSFQEIDGRLLL